MPRDPRPFDLIRLGAMVPLNSVQSPPKANSGRALSANHTRSFLVSEFGSRAYSTKLLAGTFTYNASVRTRHVRDRSKTCGSCGDALCEQSHRRWLEYL
jgi:hypothetical protein